MLYPTVFKTPIEGSLFRKNFFKLHFFIFFSFFLIYFFLLFHLAIYRRGDIPPPPSHILPNKSKESSKLTYISSIRTPLPFPISGYLLESENCPGPPLSAFT